MTSILSEAAGAAAGALLGLFGYNRENFQFDRRQRLLMELQLQGLRLEQVGLWRDDVRKFLELTPRKMEIYLLVIALELNATATALCKARVPPGSPAWLASCHTMAVCSALMYLTLALWFGLHAFVSAQAYKVRILTQLVRLPVPTWKTMEASRTYGSAFEKLGRDQMLRVPFIEGTQESSCQRSAAAAAAAASAATGAGEGGTSAAGAAGSAAGELGQEGQAISSDPWGLERPAESMAELQPGVNTTHVERQQHIWQIREAARFFQTYDAFCRVSMSAGTSSLASFFSFFCLSYVLTENAAPVAAWAGMLAFTSISVILLGNDLKINRWQFWVSLCLLVSSPLLCAIVTFVSSKNYGNPGHWEWLMPIALFNKGAWYVYYVYLFRVREMQSGSVLPVAFKGVLFVDSFGWAKHTVRHLRQAAARAGNMATTASRRRSSLMTTNSSLMSTTSTVIDGADQEAPPPAPLPAEGMRSRRTSTFAASLARATTLAFSNSPGEDADVPPEASERAAGEEDRLPQARQRTTMFLPQARQRASMILSGFSARRGDATQAETDQSVEEDPDELPSMACMSTARPTRPEDAAPASLPASGSAGPRRPDSNMYIPHVSFRPRTFAGMGERVSRPGEEQVESGADIAGELPGLVPWRYFFTNTLVVALLWWSASVMAAVNAATGTMTFVQPKYGLEPHEVAPLPLIQKQSFSQPMLNGARIATGWPSLGRAHGLACDASGSLFVSAGASAEGRRGLLHGRLLGSSASNSTGCAGTRRGRVASLLNIMGGQDEPCEKIQFEPAPSCPALAEAQAQMQDFSLDSSCNATGGGCAATVLPLRGDRLVSCPLEAQGAEKMPSEAAPAGQHLGRAWLEDRGGELDEDVHGRSAAGLLQPEELSALALAPCPASAPSSAPGGNGHAGAKGGAGCAIAATTSSRVVLLGSPAASPGRPWVPRRLLRDKHGQVGPGALALLEGRFLGVLDRKASTLDILDMHRDGRVAGTWRLPLLSRGGGSWTSICAGGGAFFAMEEREQPSIWRFPAPPELLRA